MITAEIFPHVLKNVTPADVIADPFPHIVLERAIPDDVARSLVTKYPAVETIARGEAVSSNQRFSFSARDVRASSSVDPLWKAAIEAHVSQEFVIDVLRVFRTHILAAYPDFEDRFGPFDALVARPRRTNDTVNTPHLLLDAQICINTPVTGSPNSVRKAHVDNPLELFAGLLYLRDPQDDSTGGDLDIFKLLPGKYRFHRGCYIDDKYVEKVKTIPYRLGTLVFFMNSPKSLHGVSVRGQTSVPRRFMNLVIETPKPLFDLAPLQEGRFRRMWRKIHTTSAKRRSSEY
jgi:hypothetical protein